jgi:hypothetical protein
LLFALALSLTPAFAQLPDKCGTDHIPGYKDWYRAVSAAREGQSLKTTGGPYYIPVQVHIVRESNGSGGIKKQDAMQRICELNQRFDPTNFYFYLKNDIRVINNSTFYAHTFQQGNIMMFQNNVAGALNMYFVQDAAGNCGYFSPSGGAVAITNSCAGANETTITHEVGHFFSLPHTFFGWEGGTTPPSAEQERVNGSNCSTAADNFCDTPPDYEWDRWNCSSPPTFTDLNGASFTPDGTLYMSYSDDACTNRFSTEQNTAMTNYLVNQRPDLQPAVTPGAMNFAGTTVVYPTSGMNNVSPNNTTFRWRAVPGATKYHLLVSTQPQFANPVIDAYVTNDTFYTLSGNLAPQTQHIMTVKPYDPFWLCAPYTSTLLFTTDTLMTIGITKPMLSEGIKIFPNPVGQGTSVMMEFDNETPSAYTFTLIDLMGRTVFEKAVKEKASGRQVVPMPTLETGVYLARVETEISVYTQKLVIRK